MPGAVQKDRGEPSKIRIGTIASTNPVVLDLQGTMVDSSRVGALGSYVPVTGDTVAVAGQSAVGSSASSWLILGSVTVPGASTLSTINLFAFNFSVPDHSIEELEFFAENYNTGGYVWDGFGEVTLPPLDGIYQYIFNLKFDPEPGGVRYCEIYVGGVQASHLHLATDPFAPGADSAYTYTNLGVTWEGLCTGGTPVNFRVYQDTSAPLTVSYATASIRYIGAP